MEIILLRHGKPELELKGILKASEFKQIAAAYALSGIQDFPPKKLINHFNSFYIVCSDMQRSIQSAERLGFKEIHLSDEIFRESDIPHFLQSYIKLPMILWLILFRVMWLFGFKRNGESFIAAKKRAKIATQKLIAIAHENEKVILVGHGIMNRMIAKQLRAKNWSGPISPGKKYWKFAIYSR